MSAREEGSFIRPVSKISVHKISKCGNVLNKRKYWMIFMHQMVHVELTSIQRGQFYVIQSFEKKEKNPVRCRSLNLLQSPWWYPQQSLLMLKTEKALRGTAFYQKLIKFSAFQKKKLSLQTWKRPLSWWFLMLRPNYKKILQHQAFMDQRVLHNQISNKDPLFITNILTTNYGVLPIKSPSNFLCRQERREETGNIQIPKQNLGNY